MIYSLPEPFKGIDLLSSSCITAILNDEGCLVNVNPQFCRFLELPKDAIINQPLEMFIKGNEKNKAGIFFENALGGQPENAYLGFITPGNERKIGNVTFVPLFEDQVITGVYCFIKDVSERVKENKNTFDSEQRLKAIFENVPECVKIFNPNGKLIDINPAGLQMLEAETKEQVLGEIFEGLVLKEDKSHLTAVFKEAGSGKKASLHYRIKGLKGTVRWMEANTVPLVDRYSQIYAVLVVARDVTERKKQEQVIVDSEKRFRSLVQSGSDLIGIIDRKGRYKYASPNIEAILGISPACLIGQIAVDFIHPHDLPTTLKSLTEINSTEQCILPPFRFKNGKGEWRWIETKAIDLSHEPSVNGIVVNSRDITEKRATELQLALSEQKFKSLVQNGSDIIVIIDEQGTLKYCSQNITAILGLQPEQLIHQNVFTYIPEEDKPQVLFELTKVIQKDDTAIGVQHRFLNGEGEWVWLESKGMNLLDDPFIGGIVVNARDISDRIKLQQKLDQQLANNQNEITAAVIKTQENERSQLGQELHDNVNQVLTTIKLYNEMLLDGLGNKEDLLQRSVKHLQACINEIRSISKRLSAPTLGKISLNESIRELVDSINLTNRISIEYTMGNLDDLVISQDLHLAVYRIIQEHLNNILKHADATNAKVELKHSKQHLLLTMKDDGKGFEASKKRKGIGITNMISRAEHMKGKLKLESSPGKGCTLSVRLPLA